MKPREFYDLVIEVALVRPGPIQGDMVHPYLRRRSGEEPVVFPSKELEDILGRTLGVPLFQEQAMKIAIVAAGFSPTEADSLRRSMATFKLEGKVSRFRDPLIQGMIRNGYSADYAERIFKQLEGFGSYGFPESHAVSFALLVYVSSWIKCYYPDVFACALLNSLPMGFYQPAQIVADAQKHGVVIRGVDINFSNWDHTLEEPAGKYRALRLGFRQVRGIRQEDISQLLVARKKSFVHIGELRNAGLSKMALEKLADADSFRSLGLDRRAALWELSVMDFPVVLFAGQPAHPEDGQGTLPAMTLTEQVVQDYRSISLSLKAHPVSFLRPKLEALSVITTQKLTTLPGGLPVKVAGLVLVRQRPETAKGVCFMTIEDETGFANLVIFANVFEQYRKEILQARLVMVEGKLQKDGEVVHVIVEQCHDFSKLLRHLSPAIHQIHPSLPFDAPDQNHKSGTQQKTGDLRLPDARNFH
jgi:error-prone DNA polymerase